VELGVGLAFFFRHPAPRMIQFCQVRGQLSFVAPRPGFEVQWLRNLMASVSIS
jgi:hypothetical protein